MSLCQAGNSKCLALKVFPTLTSAMEEETAVSKGPVWSLMLWTDRRVARVLGGNTGGSQVATYYARWLCHMLPSGIHKTHFRELRKPLQFQILDDAKEKGTKFYSVETDE